MNVPSKLQILVLGCLPVSAIFADPVVIYDRLGTPDTWNTGYAQLNEHNGGYWAAPFAVPNTSDYLFAGADFGADLNWTPTNVYLFADTLVFDAFHNTEFHVPGSVIEKMTISNSLGGGLDFHVNSTLHPTLQAGGWYWLTFNPGSQTDGSYDIWRGSLAFAQTPYGWIAGCPAAIGCVSSDTIPGDWELIPGNYAAFRVYADPVPEPASALELLGAVFTLIVLARNRKKLDCSNNSHRPSV